MGMGVRSSASQAVPLGLEFWPTNLGSGIQSVPTRGLSDLDMLDALTGSNQDDENKSKNHVTDGVQMHRLAASAGERDYKLCSGPTEHMEDAHGHGAANDLFPDGAHECAGDCYGCGIGS